MDDVTLRKNAEKKRYEALIGDDVAGFLDYVPLDAGVVQLPHTKVYEQHEGQGVGSALAHFALDDLRRQGQRVDPLCPFVAHWIERHPDYQPMVAVNRGGAHEA